MTWRVSYYWTFEEMRDKFDRSPFRKYIYPIIASIIAVVLGGYTNYFLEQVSWMIPLREFGVIEVVSLFVVFASGAVLLFVPEICLCVSYRIIPPSALLIIDLNALKPHISMNGQIARKITLAHNNRRTHHAHDRLVLQQDHV